MVEKVKPLPLTTRPKVSIVVPCYNYERYLAAAVTSALCQPKVEIEVIVADNGSTDNSLEVAEKLAATDDRIRIHTQVRNVDYIRNFNDGLEMATGQYAQILNADDMLTPGSITRAVALMENRPDVGFTYGSCPTFNENPPKLRTALRSWSIWDGHEWARRRYRSGSNVIRHPEALMRSSTLRAAGGYNANYPVAPDMLLWLQAAVRGNVGRVNGPDQGLFRVHGANMHLDLATEGWLTDLKGRQAVFEGLVELNLLTPVGSDDVAASRRALALRAARYASSAFDSRDSGQRKHGLAYAEFARDIWPAIEDTRRWHGVTLRKEGALPRWRSDISRVQRNLRSNVGGALNRHLRRW